MDKERGRDYTEMAPKPGPPWGFFLVLAAIVVVAIVYSVSIFALGGTEGGLTPETVFGAMAACFTVIGTLVGTYFGIKAGIDGQEKVRQSLMAGERSREQRAEDGPERNRDRRGRGQQEDELQGGALEDGERRRVEREERQEWAGGSV